MRAILALFLLTAWAAHAAPGFPSRTQTRIVALRHTPVRVVLQLAKELHPTLDFIVDDAREALVASGPKADLDAFVAFIATIDVPRKNVRLNIRVYTINIRGAKTLGLSLKRYPDGGVLPRTYPQFVPSYHENVLFKPFVRERIKPEGLAAVVASGDAKVIAETVETSGLFKHVRPFFGNELHYVTYDLQESTVRVKTVEAGLGIFAKAWVQDDGWVAIDLSPVLNVYWKGYPVRQYGRGPLSWILNTRVKSGGLISVATRRPPLDLEKQPILAHMPLLGEFLSGKTAEFLLVTVTPTILP